MKDDYLLDPGDEQKAQRVTYLISGYLRQSLTEAELDELDNWITASNENQLLFEELIDENKIQEGILKQRSIDTEKALKKLKARISGNSKSPSKRINRRITYVIAASLLLLVGLFLYSKYSKKNTTQEIADMVKDLQPGDNKAILTLGNGEMIDLKKLEAGIIKNENGISINKIADGQIIYIAKPISSAIINYNTLTTPKGGQYKVILADSTVVWLNAASSLKYPTAFSDSMRIVELTGEGYFLVAKNENKPFRVLLKNKAEVQVLGTQFNINSYDDEDLIRATLLEGSVRVKLYSPLQTEGKQIVLTPGQEAILQNNSDIHLNKDVSLQAVTAWKEGSFIFKEAAIESIMRQVARWYDVDISYEGKVNYHFTANISRNLPVSELFNVLETTNRVHFSIQGKKIIVKP